MKTTKSLLIALSAALGLTLAACGEQPQVARYEQGTYQGKADNPPWEGPAFDGDKAAWEKAVRQRTRAQNEYTRVE